jgi:hypothetical protein
VNTIIVSRHPATVAWLKERFPQSSVMAEVTADDVRGMHVVGNLPLFLAAQAARVTAVEFSGPPPRGTELTEVEAAGIRLADYVVHAIPQQAREIVFSDGRQSRGYYDELVVGSSTVALKWAGETIAGVAAIAKREYSQNGKWSANTWTIRLAPDAWAVVVSQDWETGERFHGCQSVEDAARWMRSKGATAPVDILADCIREVFPKNTERLDYIAAGLASVAP